MVNSVNYIMPAEWEKHSAVWLAWPYNKITFGSLNQKANKLDPERLAKVEKEFIKIIAALGTEERVNLIVKNIKQHPYKLPTSPGLRRTSENVRMFEADYADVWTRDYIPSFVKGQNGQLTAVKWIYNAYGKKFAGLIKDNGVWQQINKELKIETVEPGMILEAGAIDVNGLGSLLTTEQTLLNPNRNRHVNKAQIKKYLDEYLGAPNIIWLKRGLVNDHTDGHIDDIARFVAADKILAAYEDNPQDENFKILDENYKTLTSARDQNGKILEVIKLPMPHMNYNDGQKAPVSYVNFYIGNTVVLASIFNDPNDARALEILRDCFPDRKVVGIDCSDIIYGGGAVHCMTQQQPAL